MAGEYRNPLESRQEGQLTGRLVGHYHRGALAKPLQKMAHAECAPYRISVRAHMARQHYLLALFYPSAELLGRRSVYYLMHYLLSNYRIRPVKGLISDSTHKGNVLFSIFRFFSLILQ